MQTRNEVQTAATEILQTLRSKPLDLPERGSPWSAQGMWTYQDYLCLPDDELAIDYNCP